MTELNKYFSHSEPEELLRSQIRFADYNPRKISEDGRRQLKRSIKQYGVVGGIIVNRATGYTLVGGHQKVSVLDELNRYNPDTQENDYTLRVELVDVDEKTEKEMNIVLNNPNVGGEWDYDKLRQIVPDIDYKSAGLTEEDLNLIGCDFLLQTEQENDMASELESMMQPVTARREAEKAARAEERAARVEHMKDVKRQVRDQAIDRAEQMDAYVILSFDTFKAKAAFCERFGYDPYEKFIKGEVFENQVERVE